MVDAQVAVGDLVSSQPSRKALDARRHATNGMISPVLNRGGALASMS